MAKQPKIRFKGFTEEWKEKAFSELYYRAIEKNDLSFGPDKIISVANMFYRPDASGISTDEYMRTYNIMRVGDIAYEGNKSANFANGRWVENYIGDGIISHVFEVLRPKPKYDLMYWRYAINNEYIMRRKLMLSTKKATMMTNIVVPDFLKQSISVPTLQEQEKIGGFLSHIDSTISRRETELEKLINIKRALLEKLFPQDGQSTPAIRFKGFEGKWEERYAKDIFTSFEEKNHPELPVLAATQDKGMVIRDEIGYKIAHNRNNEVTYKRVLPGQFVIHLRSFQGGFAHSNVEGITSPAYDVFGFKNPEEHDDYFWKYIFSSAVFIKRLVKVTYGIRDGRNVSYAEFLELPFMVPSKKEQTRIANSLKSISDGISLRERQLTLLKHSKQALLEQMFVNE